MIRKYVALSLATLFVSAISAGTVQAASEKHHAPMHHGPRHAMRHSPHAAKTAGGAVNADHSADQLNEQSLARAKGEQ